MKHRFAVLDIFRGIFASMVVLFHLAPFADTPILNNSFILNSDLFVDFFFVLSGFVITYTYQSLSTANETKLFYKKRLFRLYPLHLIMLLLFVAVEVGKKFLEGHIQINQPNNENNNLLTFFSNLLFLHSVKLPGVTDVSWNIPSWSISAEMIAYIVFGTATFYINRNSLFKVRNIIYVLIALGSLAALYIITNSFELTYSFNYGFLRAIAGFFTGVICFNTFIFAKRYADTLSGSLFSFAEMAVLVIMIVSVSMGYAMKDIGFVYELIFFMAILVFSFERGIISENLKKSAFLHKLGTYSYSVYMVHALFISLFNILFIRVLHFPPSAYSYLFLLNFYIIYKVSEWTYQHVELRFSYKKK